ncbi:catecholate siderophore receptor [Rhizomicrobium palustre]|uniref:Catecholate siderophore receptor n=1 Tax=Rhizomicrobium palustre TaxID=189966 RepID=A0A846N2D1_9PROT|nr:TonB-dependent receptor [Rhizomicrobium palustre]NIK89645.1 catecholate siderophore receptor [Rhizomicrobium palustre]
MSKSSWNVLFALCGLIGPATAETMSVETVRVDGKASGTELQALPTSIQDTPQAIQVISKEILEQQKVGSLEQALRNVPGITIAIGEGGALAGDQFKIRGFDAKDDVYLDGLRDFGVYSRDSFNDQEIEVLKGPSGALFGRGTTGGAINIVSKTPEAGDHISAQVIGGDKYLRGTADLNLALSDTAAVRLNVMGNWTGVEGRDVVYSHRWGVAPSIAFGIGTNTTFSLSALHQQSDAIPDYGLPVSVDPITRIAKPVTEKGIPRSNFLGYDRDRDSTTADILTAKFKTKLSDGLTLANDTRIGIYSRYFQYTTVDRCDETAATNTCATNMAINPATAYGGIGGGGPYRQAAWGIQDIASAKADYDLLGLRSQTIFGVDVSYQRNKRTFYAYTLPAKGAFNYLLGNGSASRTNIGVSLLNPVHTPPAGYSVYLPTLNGALPALTTASPSTNLYASGDATDVALFAVERLWFTPHWSVIGNLRWDHYDSSYATQTIGSPTTSSATAALSAKSEFFSPRGSLVFEPSEDQTFYFTFGRSNTPQGTSIVGAGTGIAATTADLKPEVAETMELGAKLGLAKLGLEDFMLTGSLFVVNKQNATKVDSSTGDVLSQSGERQRAQGIELGLSGKLLPDWSFTASYTFLDTKTRDSYVNCIAAPPAGSIITGVICPTGIATGSPVRNSIAIGRQITYTPKNAATLWTSYKFPFGMEAGGGLFYQSALYNAFTPASASVAAPATQVPYRIVKIPETIQLDLFAAYEVQNWRLGLNVINATDRLNYAQSFSNRATPAPSRTFMFSVSTAY